MKRRFISLMINTVKRRLSDMCTLVVIGLLLGALFAGLESRRIDRLLPILVLAWYLVVLAAVDYYGPIEIASFSVTAFATYHLLTDGIPLLEDLLERKIQSFIYIKDEGARKWI